MMKVLRVSLVFWLGTFLIIPQAGLAQITPDPHNGPLEVFLAGIEALGNDGVNASLAYWSDDAVIQEIPPINRMNVSIYKGKEQIGQWMQRVLDNFNDDPSDNLVVNGDKLTLLAHIHNLSLSQAGIDVIDANQEWIITAGKVKSVTITATPESVEKLKKAGLLTTETVQGQGVAVTPSGTPASGFGPAYPDTGWLTLPPVLIDLIVLCGTTLWLMHRRNRNKC